MIFVALGAPLIAPQDPLKMNLSERYNPPQKGHIFGQDEYGRDVFSQVVYGARTSLTVALVVVLVSALVGLILGSLAGYNGGILDRMLVSITDIFYAFPGFLLALGVMAVLKPSLWNIVLALCLTTWSGFARLVRGEVLYLKEKEFIKSALALGFSPFRTLCWHIWPNLLGILVIQMSLTIAAVVISESGLSFLGLGVPQTVPTWGALLNSGRKILLEAPHVSLFPGVAILISVLGANLLGEGLRDAFDRKK